MADVETRSVTSNDGTRLHLRRWPAASPRAALLIVHGYFEHGGRYEERAHTLAARDIETWALDLRGHGGSDGRRGVIRRFEEYLEDVDAALSAASTQPRFLLGHSLGGLVAFLWTARREPSSVRGVILTNPYLERAVHVPAWKIGLAGIIGRIAPAFSLPSGLDPSLLSHDTARNEAYRHDPLIFEKASSGWFLATNEAQEEAAQVESLPLPVLWVVGEGDQIAKPAASLAALKRISSPDLTPHILPGQFHEVLQETERKELFKLIGDWIEAHVG